MAVRALRHGARRDIAGPRSPKAKLAIDCENCGRIGTHAFTRADYYKGEPKPPFQYPTSGTSGEKPTKLTVDVSKPGSVAENAVHALSDLWPVIAEMARSPKPLRLRVADSMDGFGRVLEDHLPPELRERFRSLRRRVAEVETNRELDDEDVQDVADEIPRFYDALQEAAAHS